MIKFYKIPFFERLNFNCGGFALGTCEWERFICFDRRQEYCFNQRNFYKRYRAMGKITYQCAQELLEKYPRQLRLVKDESEKLSYEEIFFFRVSSDGDFHFVLKHGRKYLHKRGNTPWLDEMSKEEVYSSAWCNRYDGPMLIFAKTKRPFSHKELINDHDKDILEKIFLSLG